MKKLFLIVLFCSLVFPIQAQNFELGKVTKAELEQKKHPIDSSASAAILFKKAKTLFRYKSGDGFVSYTEFSIKIKIYKTEGLKWANYEIPYYVGYESKDDESVEISKGFTYNLENGEVKKDPIKKENKFNEAVNEHWKTISITFPNVKVGSIIEFKYILKSPNLTVLPEFQYQYNIPVDFAEYNTEIPEFYLYKAIKNGFVDVTSEESLVNSSESFSNGFGNPVYMSFRSVKSKYITKNIPALIEEKYVNNIDNYYGKIEYELQTIRMPNEKPKQLATTWEDVVKSIYEEKEFGAELTKFNYYSNDIKPLVQNLATAKEKTTKIFDFVKDRMSWNGKFGYFTKKGTEAAYKEKSGNIAEINLMLISMLKMAGLDANPVLMSTRKNGIALFPNRTRFNYVIACVIIDGKKLLMDASDKLGSINILPLRDLNWTGRLVGKDGTSTEIDLMPKDVSKKNTNLMANISDSGEIDGKIKEQYFDYNAFSFRNEYSGLATESYLEKLEKRNNNIVVSDYSIVNKLDLDKPVVETYSFKHNSSIDVIGDKMYFSPLLFFTQTINPFKQEKRSYPVDFTFPNQERYLINITIPEGYAVESLPTPLAIKFGEDLGFKFNIATSGKQIQITAAVDISTSIIPSESYADLKTFYAAMIQKQTEKVVLKKI